MPRRGRFPHSMDIPLDPKFEHLHWLRNFIISRASTTNFKKNNSIIRKARKGYNDPDFDPVDEIEESEPTSEPEMVGDEVLEVEETNTNDDVAPNIDLQAISSISDGESRAESYASSAYSQKPKTWMKTECRKGNWKKLIANFLMPWRV